MHFFRHECYRTAANAILPPRAGFSPARIRAMSGALSLMQVARLWEHCESPEATLELEVIYDRIIARAQTRLDADNEFDFLRRRANLNVSNQDKRARWLCEFATRAGQRGLSGEAHSAIEEACSLAKDNPSLHAEVLINKAILLGQKRDFENSIACFQLAIDHAVAVKNLVIQARAYLNASSCYLRNGYTDDALGFAQKAETAYKTTGNLSGAGKALHQQARVLFRNGQRESGVDLLNEARELFELVGEQLSSARVTSELAGFQLQAGNIFDAEDGYKRALKDFRILKSGRDELIVLSNLALVATNKGDFKRAISLCEETIRQAQLQGSLTQQAYALLQMTTAFLALEKLPQARERLDKATSFAGDVGMSLFHLELNRLTAEVQFGEGDLTSAIESMTNARELAQDGGFADVSVHLLSRESFLSSELGDFRRAREAGLQAMMEAEGIDGDNGIHQFIATSNMARIEALDGNAEESEMLREDAADLWNANDSDVASYDHTLRSTLEWLRRAGTSL
ncbi:hypothetical protein OAU50_02700 [Planctomycetota bacterium]|nr:hypothetical protein [Planctomycetota bacterium]